MRRGAACRCRPDRVVLTSGTSEGIELALTALAEAGRRGARPGADLSALHGGAGEDRRPRRCSTGRIRRPAGCPDLDHIRSLITPATRALVSIDPNNPTGAVYPPEVRRALVELADEHEHPAPRRRGLRRPRVRRPASAPSRSPIPMRRSSRSRRCPRPTSRPAGAPAGWRSGRTPTARRRAGGGEEARGRTAVRDRTDGVRDHRGAQRRPLAPGSSSATRCAARAELTTARLNAIDGITVVRADGGVLRDAAGRAAARRRPTRTTCSACCAPPACCASTAPASAPGPEDGFFRIVFLASPAELASIYDDIGRFTARLPRRAAAALSGRRDPDAVREEVAQPLDHLDDGARRRRCCGRRISSATSCCSSTSAACWPSASARSCG